MPDKTLKGERVINKIKQSERVSLLFVVFLLISVNTRRALRSWKSKCTNDTGKK